MARLLPGTRALRTLEAAARHLNFTRAADELGLTPAAVSHQIKEIEDQLGLVLFTRTSRTIRLTPDRPGPVAPRIGLTEAGEDQGTENGLPTAER